MSLIKKLKKCILQSVIKPFNDFVLSHYFINYSSNLTSAPVQKCSPSVLSLQFHKGIPSSWVMHPGAGTPGLVGTLGGRLQLPLTTWGCQDLCGG